MTDTLLDRLTMISEHESLTAIPWPKGLEPSPKHNFKASENDKLPRCDVLVVTWTAAESEALADVFTPGIQRTNWLPYARNWDKYESQLTGRSPAKFSKCMANYYPTQIGTKTVNAVKSNLHLATDGTTMPVGQLWQQMIEDCQPSLIITTGTAGGIGSDIVLGDVAIATAAQFNCQKDFKSKIYANDRYVSSPLAAVNKYMAIAESQLMPVNASHLRPIATRDPKVWSGVDVETVDYFGFDDTDDSYGIVKDDSRAKTEEMDDATLGYAISQMKTKTPWISVRNASDPMVPSSVGDLQKQKKWASHIYLKYGYYTTVMSAIACWALIADLT